MTSTDVTSVSGKTNQGESVVDTQEDDLELTKPVFKNGRFENPWATWKELSLQNVWKFRWEKEKQQQPSNEELDRTLPVLRPELSQFAASPEKGVRCMWIGHASCLVQFDGVTVLTDPVFSSRCSPIWFLGPKRYRDPPCKIEELPHIDVVLISHNHYDHLDVSSVTAINNKYGQELRWYVPMGIKKWMNDQGCENVVELSWWDEDLLPGKSEVKVACTPCQHWCRRTISDTNKALWSSWAMIGPHHRFYFGGDTGYCEGFKQIGRKYGPFSLAAIPIGCYKPHWFLSPQHVGPKEAVQIHQDVRACNSVGIHWGTFHVMAYEHYLEPREDLVEESANANLKPDEFVTLQHGEIVTFGGEESV